MLKHFYAISRLTARVLLPALLVFSVLSADKSGAQTEGGSPGTNILFILDASGSMAGRIDGKPKMDVAKEVMTNLIDGLPTI